MAQLVAFKNLNPRATLAIRRTDAEAILIPPRQTVTVDVEDWLVQADVHRHRNWLLSLGLVDDDG